ncbi:hypothetical protein FRC17_010246 [Serendipita sp. 399]|nr:hypothetical protein FRC17_010246 [Serendipita sp. 399]
MSAFRLVVRPFAIAQTSSPVFSRISSQRVSVYLQKRLYAKKKNNNKDEDEFHHLKPKRGKQHKPDEIVVEQNNITDPSLKFVPSSLLPHGADYDREEKAADEKMNSSIRWFKEQVRNVETRSTGRVVPDILDGVKVSIPMDPDNKSSGNMEVGLKEIATVGVKHGNTLVVTVFEEYTLRAVEKALYDAQLPGLTPNRTDARTILMPVSQPTVESRNALLAALQKQAEETKVAIRKVHQTSQKKVKTLGFDHKSGAMTDLTALVNKRIEEVDSTMEKTRKTVLK